MVANFAIVVNEWLYPAMLTHVKLLLVKDVDCANMGTIRLQRDRRVLVMFRQRPPAKGVGLRVADSHTGNHPEDDWPLETIRRPYSIIRKRILFELEREAFEPEGRVRHQAPQSNVMYASMNALLLTSNNKSLGGHIKGPGLVGLYIHHFSLSNLRLPIPLFICDVLNYFKAYGGEPFVDLLHSFLKLGRAGDWLILSNRGGADVPKALIKPITHLENWKGSFFYIENKIIPSKYSKLLLKDNKNRFQEFYNPRSCLPKGGFDNNQGSLSAKSVNNETPIIDAEPISTVLPSNVADNIIDSSNTSFDAELPLVHPSTSSFPEVSKVAGDASTPLNDDSDPNIHEFPSTRELKDATDCHWVVAHVTPPS
ncbi:hypothetical protein Tco_0812173 [Tanacetum coccineum]